MKRDQVSTPTENTPETRIVLAELRPELRADEELRSLPSDEEISLDNGKFCIESEPVILDWGITI